MTQFNDYLKILIRNWWIIALTGLGALSLALISSYFATPTFRSSARFIVSPGPALLSGDERDLINSITALDKRSIVSTYAEIMNSRHIHRDAGLTLGLSTQEIADYAVTAVVLPESSALELFVEGPNPIIVAQMTNTAGSHAINQIQNLYQAYNITWLDSASIPQKPISPNPARDASVAFFLGLVAGIGLALASEQLPKFFPKPDPADLDIQTDKDAVNLQPNVENATNRSQGNKSFAVEEKS